MKSRSGSTRFKSTSPTAAVAYRKDVESRKSPIGADDGSWIVIATIVGHIAYAEGSERRRFLDDAAKMAAELFAPEALLVGCSYDPRPVDRRSSIAVLRLLAERMELLGAVNLSSSLLDSLASVLPIDSLNAGRVLSQRARIAWKLGKVDLATARYQHLRRKARKLESNELLVRSWAGFSGVAHMRGNYPDLRRWSQLIVDLAERCGYTRLSAVGHHGLAAVFAKDGDSHAAIPHAWAGYRARSGDEKGQLAMLNNIGQLFLEIGQPAVARTAFSRVLGSDPTLQTVAAALGGYASACAALDDRRAVTWAAGEAASLSNTIVRGSYELAAALIDCADALELIGDAPYALVLRARGSAVAQYAGYHELVFKTETAIRGSVSKDRVELQGLSVVVAEEIAKLPAVVLPDHLELVSA